MTKNLQSIEGHFSDIFKRLSYKRGQNKKQKVILTRLKKKQQQFQSYFLVQNTQGYMLKSTRFIWVILYLTILYRSFTQWLKKGSYSGQKRTFKSDRNGEISAVCHFISFHAVFKVELKRVAVERISHFEGIQRNTSQSEKFNWRGNNSDR